MDKIKEYIREFFIIFFLGMIIFSGFNIVRIGLEYKKGEDTYNEASQEVELEVEKETSLDLSLVTDEGDSEEIEDNILDMIASGVAPEDIKMETEEKEEAISLSVNWDKFNDKVIGWIKIDGNDIINYPVVQSFDNEYYLKHLYDDTYNSSGSIFVSKKNNGFKDKHIVIHGHNLKNGTMFTSLKNYLKQDYADEHRYIYIAEPNGKTRVFYVYSCFTTHSLGEEDGFNAYTVNFADKSSYSLWINQTVEKSQIESILKVTRANNILTLSTCMSRGDKYERCVVHAVEIENVIKK